MEKTDFFCDVTKDSKTVTKDAKKVVITKDALKNLEFHRASPC